MDAIEASASQRAAVLRASAAKSRAVALADEPAPEGNSEVFTSIIIEAGKSAYIESTMNFSAASGVAVTVHCTLCTTSATSLASSLLVIQALWAVPEADTYVAAEAKAASNFLYWDAGSALFNAYGSSFRLALQNKGTQSLMLSQVTLFRRVR